MEPLSKDLGFGIAVRLDEDGNLTLTEVQSVPAPDVLVMDGPEEEEIVITEIALPPQAARALLNLLRRAEVRERIRARK